MRSFSRSVLLALTLLTGLSCSVKEAARADNGDSTSVTKTTKTTIESTNSKGVTTSTTTSEAPVKQRYKVGLILGGGGTRGAAHVGVLKVLKEEGIPFDCIVGTSMGAVVGGLYSAGVPIPEMEKAFRDRSLMRSFMTVSLPTRIVLAPILFIPRLLGAKPFDGLYYGNKFRVYLDKLIGTPDQNIQDLKFPYAACCVDVVEGHPFIISKGSLGYAMQATAAVPGLRKPVLIGDKLYCDGGVAANVPVIPAKKQFGVGFVIAVNVDENLPEVSVDSFRKPGSMSKQIINVQLRNLDESEGAAADVLIHPNVDGISLISTNKDDAERAMKAGEEAARAALPEIKEKLARLGVACVPKQVQ